MRRRGNRFRACRATILMLVSKFTDHTLEAQSSRFEHAIAFSSSFIEPRVVPDHGAMAWRSRVWCDRDGVLPAPSEPSASTNMTMLATSALRPRELTGERSR